MAGIADSAFLHLERIAIKANYSNHYHITTDPDLAALQNDKRWLPLIKAIKKNKEKEEVNFDKPLINLLDSLVSVDQKWRVLVRKFDNKELVGENLSKEEIIKNIRKTDSLNYVVLKRIINKHGFPNYDLVGESGSHNFWLLVQHQDKHPSFQDSVLRLMKVEVDKKKANPTNYVYLVDRVKINTGQLQVYGTQMVFNKDSTTFEPKPVIDPENLNLRRKSIGMPDIEVYISEMNKNNHGILKSK